MDYGLAMFATDYAIRPDDLARAAEERGFESLWFPEHTHIPAARTSPWPGGTELPREYWHTYDLFVALTLAAGATSRLKVGSGICLLVERDPITTAKTVASLDRLSGGRLLFGIGGGWNAEEMANHGTAFRTRWALLRERVLAMKAIWREEEPHFEGEHVRFEPLWSWPKPLQLPHPPIVLGSNAKRAPARVVDYCDGWMPIAARTRDLAGDVARLRALADEHGRDPETIPVTLYGPRADEASLAGLRDLGIARAVLPLPSAGPDGVLPLLDRWARLAESVG